MTDIPIDIRIYIHPYLLLIGYRLYRAMEIYINTYRDGDGVSQNNVFDADHGVWF